MPIRGRRGAKILICDNEEPLRALGRASLNGAEYELHEAHDGDEALELVRELRPDLVVLDIMMFGRSGLEVLAEVRADEALRGTPVIMLTARAQAADVDAAHGAGADLFLPKPFSPAALARAVETLLARRGLRQLLRSAHRTGDTAAPDRATLREWPIETFRSAGGTAGVASPQSNACAAGWCES